MVEKDEAIREKFEYQAESGTSKFLKALKENKVLGADKSPRLDKQYVFEAITDNSSYVDVEEEEEPNKGEEQKVEGEKKKVKKTKIEKDWDWELTNETKPI
ncbi:Endoplasmin protein [Spatholobus suberectus]|nr:Endoplasmin protein [Spatholobus suberectus]